MSSPEWFTYEQAVEFAESEGWKDMSLRARAEFQMLVERGCMPFRVFHEAIEKTLGRPVYTHEFGVNWQGLKEELFDGKPAPTMEEIIGMIPEHIRVIVVAPPES